MDLSIIILNYKSADLVKYQLQKLYYFNFDFSSEIIVVDNDSKDHIEDALEDFPNVRFVKSKTNRGMGGGNNLGIKEAYGEYVMILNPDLRIEKETIEKMFEFIKNHDNVGLASPRLVNADFSLQETCYAFPDWKYPIYRRTYLGNTNAGKKWNDNLLMRSFDHLSIKKVDWVQGSCFIAKKSVLEELGFFDENIFMYLEDMDLCRRLWEKNKPVYYLGNIFAIHLHQKASLGKNIFSALLTNKLSRAHLKSWLYYILKYRGKNLPSNCPSKIKE